MDIMRQVESLESGKGINLKCADWFRNNKQTKLTMKPTPKTERAATHRGLIKLEVLRGCEGRTLTWSVCCKLMGYFGISFRTRHTLFFLRTEKGKLIVHFFRFSGSKSGAYYLKTKEPQAALTYCHMVEISGCGGGGWTLVMKIDGAKVEKVYKTVSKILRLSNLSVEDSR